ncbi:MAG: hypothetical protein IJM14_06440 [Lachnospiraceae bacterium]|nr:hypothetical protein [Lachnospiraceae bacterium]
MSIYNLIAFSLPLFFCQIYNTAGYEIDRKGQKKSKYYEKRKEKMSSFVKRIKYKFTITVATAGIIVGFIGTLIGAGTAIILKNGSEAQCDYSFNNSDREDYVTIDPKSGTIKYNLKQTYVTNSSYPVYYKVGYKATFQSNYDFKNEVILYGSASSTGFTKLVKQYGVRDYKVKLRRISDWVGVTKGSLILKVT